MSDSPFRKFLAKGKDVIRPRVRRKAGSPESLSPGAKAPKNTSVASSHEFSPMSLGKTQVHYAEPQEIERSRVPPIVPSSAPVQVSSQLKGNRPNSLSTPLSTPWEVWTLDQDFLVQIYTWNAAHPDNTLGRIFNKTSTLIERHEVLLELVPDGPIPFRGFVKALAHLVKLGMAIAEAKVVALQFAQDVLQWVEKLATAFRDGGGGPFIEKVWVNLADIRQLIEEVCIWAHRILKGGLAERISVKNTIVKYRERFTQAIERFGVVSHIHIAIGHDRLNQHLSDITRAQDSLVVSNTHMTQELVTIRRALVQKRQSTMPDPTYQVQKKIPCDPGTRKQVLDNIMKWIFDISDGSPCFFWLSGDPGVGKSAVTASIARECIHRNVLWAQYFINRNDAQTVDPQLYFLTIAKQMAGCAPAVHYAVEKTLLDHPYLMTDDISLDQATKLFVDTIRVAAASTPTMPVAVVIDALDETDQKRLKVTAEIFSRILVDLPPNAKVFISSRVETVIRDSFTDLPRVQNIHLSARNSIADVTMYLEVKVQEIMKEHHISWPRWGQERMRKLCSQASGLFIWAVTAIKYIQSQIEDFGMERLDVVLDELNAFGMQDINALYVAILKRTYQRETTPWQIQCFRRIIGAILAQRTPLSIDDLKGLLDLRNPTSKAPVDVEHFIRRLRTILVPSIDEITGRTIPRVHKSFSDFITSAKAQEFRVDMVESNGELALQCIDRLERLWEGKMPGQLRYAISHWSSHLARVVGVPMDEGETEDDATSVDDAHSQVSNPQKSPTVSVEPRLKGELEDGDQLYSIAASPDGTRVVHARSESFTLVDIETGDLIQGPFTGHTDIVNTAVFSSDGRYIVSASDDKTVRIWDATTGEPVGQPLNGHTDYVFSAFFSPDGKQVVSGSRDNTICIWDGETGALLHRLVGHRETVRSAMFSPDGRRIVSSSRDATVRVWNSRTGEAEHILAGHTPVKAAFFSPDWKNILSYGEGSHSRYIVWDSDTGEKIPEYSSSNNPRLSFLVTGSAEDPYIETPPKSNTPPEDGTIQLSSYVFRVGENGVACGTGNGWLYRNNNSRFVVSTYLGQLIMIYLFN